MNLDELLQKLAPWRDSIRRTAWKPVTKLGDGPAKSHKFSGVPWLAADEDWPLCPNCKQPMQLFVQVNLADLPEELGRQFGVGLLQLFYCTNFDDQCDVELQGWDPFSKVHLARVVQPTGAERTDVTMPPGHFPAKSIVGWEPIDDYPMDEDQTEPGPEIDYDFKKNTASVTWDETGLAVTGLAFDEAEAISPTARGDKLAGWPNWVQGPEYPDCPQCGEQMELVFQIDSEDNLPFMFGDVGCGHITQCPTHKDVVAFGWACC
jgi:uncharacterized protein YwqG